MKKITGFLCLIVLIGVLYAKSHDNSVCKVGIFNLAAIAYSSPENPGGGSCSATANCFLGTSDKVTGSVSCTGTIKCISGYEYVSCDGNESKCN